MNMDDEQLKVLAREWIMSKVKIDKKGCFIWQGPTAKEWSRAKCGEHRVKKYNLVSNQASRAAFALFKPDEFDPDLLVLHKAVCGKKNSGRCVNPDHLTMGTHAQNNQEKFEFGLGKTGETHASAIYTNAQIRKIKRLIKAGKPNIEIARLMGCVGDSYSKEYKRWTNLISDIRIKKIWRYT